MKNMINLSSAELAYSVLSINILVLNFEQVHLTTCMVLNNPCPAEPRYTLSLQTV